MASLRSARREKSAQTYHDFRQQMRLVMFLVVLTTASCIVVAYSAVTMLASSTAAAAGAGSLRLHRQYTPSVAGDQIVAEDTSMLSAQVSISSGISSTTQVGIVEKVIPERVQVNEEETKENVLQMTLLEASTDTGDAGSSLTESGSTSTTLTQIADMHPPAVGDAQPLLARTVSTDEPFSTPVSTDSFVRTPTTSPKVETFAPIFFSSEECFNSGDYGVVDELRSSLETFCSPANPDNSATSFHSSYTTYRSVRANIDSTVFQKLRIDMSTAEVAHDITSLADDGGQHDPRYRVGGVRRLCRCEGATPRHNWALEDTQVWRAHLADDKGWGNPTYLPPSESARAFFACSEPDDTDIPRHVIDNPVRVLMVTRKDDHNPFFQISHIFNTWVMMKALDWSNLATQLVYLDKAIPSPVDQLRWKMLAPEHEPVYIHDLAQQPDSRPGIIEFGTALLSPFEAIGPMMRHLNDDEPCARSHLWQDFRSTALATMDIYDYKGSSSACTITIISRRNYGGRKVQRVWINEDEVLHRMQADFGERCTVQSVDFVNLTMAEQMQKIVSSDVIIGMHGAGMVNVLWTRPGTLVVEIFPKRRFRWGFRNVCQRVGCDWYQFRGGRDLMTQKSSESNSWLDPNTFDKVIPPDEWAAFANSLIEKTIAR